MTKKLFSLKVTFHLSLRPIDIILIKKKYKHFIYSPDDRHCYFVPSWQKKRTRAIYRIIVIGNTCMLI